MIGMGGFTGAICRYLTYEFSNKVFSEPFFPYGTLIVNTIGCLLIGFLGGLFETRQIFVSEVRAVIFIGFLGGYTTYSTFGFEIFMAARNDQVAAAFTNFALHIILGIGAVWGGYSLNRLM